jgi:hypothetical protein
MAAARADGPALRFHSLDRVAAPLTTRYPQRDGRLRFTISAVDVRLPHGEKKRQAR